MIDEVVVQAEQVADILWLPDLLRARGEILLAQRRPDVQAAEESLLRSMMLPTNNPPELGAESRNPSGTHVGGPRPEQRGPPDAQKHLSAVHRGF